MSLPPDSGRTARKDSMRRLVPWSALPLLAAPVGSWALGLGDIELRSALNQPFQAEISYQKPGLSRSASASMKTWFIDSTCTLKTFESQG